MKFPYILYFIAISIAIISCEKKELPYKIPERPIVGDSMREDRLELGEDYENTIFYSLRNGVVKQYNINDWDICFTTNKDSNEIFLNGGKMVLAYLTDATSFEQINKDYNFNYLLWRYDATSQLKGTSGIGILNNSNIIGKVIVLKINNTSFKKLIVQNITDTSYSILCTNNLDDNAAQTYTIIKDNKVSNIYFGFEKGIQNLEPPKQSWDIVFTLYRYIYEKYNPDGTDFLYQVAGVLLNPYKTEAARDTMKQFDYFTFTKDTFEQYLKLYPNRDVIGWNWKDVDINTVKYTVRPRIIYVIKDQEDVLWKLHFFGYHNDQGQNGYPQFRYEKLE
jgi:hypothetical protein